MSEVDDLKELLLREIVDIKKKVEPKRAKQFSLDLTEKIVHRLSSFAECQECQEYMNTLEKDLSQIIQSLEISQNPTLKKFNMDLKEITTHLQKEHKLVTEGYYSGVYMSIGLALGLPIGLAFAQMLGNTAYMSIGLPIGLAIGLSIGSGLDAKAKKEGHVI